MRATGGGNVIAYNYMDDSYGATYPQAPEAGLNAGHYTTPHMELLEGNYSHNYKGDSFWGNSIYITVFRNWLSALRAARPPLNTYTFKSGNCILKYGDYSGRAAVDVQAFSYDTNFVGNILAPETNNYWDTTRIPASIVRRSDGRMKTFTVLCTRTSCPCGTSDHCKPGPGGSGCRTPTKRNSGKATGTGLPNRRFGTAASEQRVHPAVERRKRYRTRFI